MSGSRTRGVAKPDAPHPISDPKLFLLGGISLVKIDNEVILSWAGIRTRDIGMTRLCSTTLPSNSIYFYYKLPNGELKWKPSYPSCRERTVAKPGCDETLKPATAKQLFEAFLCLFFPKVKIYFRLESLTRFWSTGRRCFSFTAGKKLPELENQLSKESRSDYKSLTLIDPLIWKWLAFLMPPNKRLSGC